jgi:RHS repeat-associated protein
VDKAGNIVEKLHYNTTGLCKSYQADDATATLDDNGYVSYRARRVPFGYCGMYIEPFTGKGHTLYRDYDALHNMWLSRDPIAEQGGINLTGYCNGNAVDGVDPYGLWNLWNIATWFVPNGGDVSAWHSLNPFDETAAGRASASGAGKGAIDAAVGIGKFAYGATVGLGEQITLTTMDVGTSLGGGSDFNSAWFGLLTETAVSGESLTKEVALDLSGYRFGNQIYENAAKGFETGDFTGFSESMGQRILGTHLCIVHCGIDRAGRDGIERGHGSQRWV